MCGQRPQWSCEGMFRVKETNAGTGRCYAHNQPPGAASGTLLAKQGARSPRAEGFSHQGLVQARHRANEGARQGFNRGAVARGTWKGLVPTPGDLLVFFGLDLLLLLLDQWPRRFVCQSYPHPCHFD